MPSPAFWRREPSSPQRPQPSEAEAEAEAEAIVHGPITFRVPLLTRLEHFGEELSDRFHGAPGDGPAPGEPAAPGHRVAHAVVEVPAASGLHRFFGNPLEGVEAVAARVMHRAVREAELSITRFVCRWAGAGIIAGLGLWAGQANLRARESWPNPSGTVRPWLGWPLILAAAFPLPVAGAWLGRGVAHLGTLDLQRASASPS